MKIVGGAKYGWLLRVRPAILGSFLKRLIRVHRRVVATGEGNFFIDPASNFGYAMLSEEGYEPEMTRSIKQILHRGDVFLDIGANEGYFSIVASRLVGQAGKILAVEPQRRRQDVLFRNLLENSALNVHVFQVAITDAAGFCKCIIAPDMNTGSSGLFRTTKYTCPTELVPQVTLSGLLGLLSVRTIKLMWI
jgi:FkbM family methyltransferase